MTNDPHSGSRWEPEHRHDETAELPAPTQPTVPLSVEQGTTGTQDGVPVPPGGGQLPDSGRDGTPDFGGRGATDDPADNAGDPV